MTTIQEPTPQIRETSVIPTVESRLFDQHPDARFAIGKLALGPEVIEGLEKEYIGYLRLRANVYAGQTGMLSESRVNEDGTETDEDDKRSVHIGILENTGETSRVVAAMRLIVKDGQDSDKLPIEKFYPEAFEVVAGDGSTEVSRYISRHEDGAIQEELSWPLYSAALSHIMTNELGPTYAVIEPGLERRLRAFAMPLKRLAEPKFIAAYNDVNLPVEVDTTRFARIVRARNPGAYATMLATKDQFTYFDVQRNEPVRAPREAA